MKFPGLLNKAKAKDTVSDVITVNNVTDLPYNSKSGSIAEVTNINIKELKLNELLPDYFYIIKSNTQTGNIACTDNNEFLTIQDNLEAVYYDQNNIKKVIHYLEVIVNGQIYRQYKVQENLNWRNLNNIKIFTFNQKKAPYIYNGNEWEQMDYVQKDDFVFDTAPTEGSSSILTSGVIYSELSNKADLVDGKVPSDQLPSYVDDVVEFPSFQEFPEIGESGKIYIDISTNSCYRWSGSTYIEIQSPIELDEYPTQDSENAVQSGGVYSALQEKQDIISDLSEIRQGANLGATALQSGDGADMIAYTESDSVKDALDDIYSQISTGGEGNSLADRIEALEDGDNLIQGTNVTLTKDTINHNVTITATDEKVKHTLDSSTASAIPMLLAGTTTNNDISNVKYNTNLSFKPFSNELRVGGTGSLADYVTIANGVITLKNAGFSATTLSPTQYEGNAASATKAYGDSDTIQNTYATKTALNELSNRLTGLFKIADATEIAAIRNDVPTALEYGYIYLVEDTQADVPNIFDEYVRIRYTNDNDVIEKIGTTDASVDVVSLTTAEINTIWSTTTAAS